MSISVVETEENQLEGRIAIRLETIIYLILILVIVGLRAINIGEMPLNHQEAAQASIAWDMLNGGVDSAVDVENPFIFAGMTASLGILRGDAAARFFPMLGGILLTLTPLLFQKRLGTLPTLITVGLLAISPTAVALSRQVTGISFSMVAILGILAALEHFGQTQNRRDLIIIGVLAGIALLSDFGTPLVLIMMMIGAGFMLLTDESEMLDLAEIKAQAETIHWRYLWMGLGVTLLLPGLLFFLIPNGLGATGNQIARFVQGITQNQLGLTHIGIVLGAYEILLIMFGLIGAGLASRSESHWQRFLAGWGIAAFLIGTVYPGAEPGHALWSIVPLAGLSGLLIADLISETSIEPDLSEWGIWSYGLSVMFVIGIIFGYLSRALRGNRIVNSEVDWLEKALGGISLDLILLIPFCLLLLILWLFVATLWGMKSAWRGMGIGFLIAGLMVSTGQSGLIAFTDPANPYQVLHPAPAQPGLSILIETAEDVSKLSTGQKMDASITVQGDRNDAVAWALGQFSDITYVERVDPLVDSIMVITPAGGIEPALGSNYVGQDFVIVRSWTPVGLPFRDFVSWVVYRTSSTPTTEDRVILWVREDLYRLVYDRDAP